MHIRLSDAENDGHKLHPYYITVDPSRDDVPAMKAYCEGKSSVNPLDNGLHTIM